MVTRIVELTGGLGNQMFQYEFGRYLQKRYPADIIKYDLSYFSARNSIRDFALGKAFGIVPEAANVKEIRKVRGYSPYDGKVMKLLSGIVTKKAKIPFEVVEDLDREFSEDYVGSETDTYYSGYWQNEKVFSSFREEVLKDYNVSDEFPCELTELLQEIKDTEAVAVHVRLEDYLQDNNYKVYGGICTREYYEKAISYITENVQEPVFYLFSTDLDSAREYLPDGIECHQMSYKGQRDYLDMYLMSRCKHHIIANSTFSWWGAWLNRREDKIVVCPGRWFNNHDVYNQYCDGWIRI